MKRVLVSFVVLLILCGAGLAQGPPQKAERKQFVYVLKLVPRLLEAKNWTDADGRIVERHFRRLQRLHKEGRVILAGRTLNESDASQFGVVIFEADSEAEARALMEEDDAVKEKIMTAQLFPFRVALVR